MRTTSRSGIVALLSAIALALGTVVGIVSPASATSADLVAALKSTCAAYGAGVDEGGTIICISGPQVQTFDHVIAFCDNHATTADFADTANVARFANLGTGTCAIINVALGGEPGAIAMVEAVAPQRLVGGPAPAASPDPINTQCAADYAAGVLNHGAIQCLNPGAALELNLQRVYNAHSTEDVTTDATAPGRSSTIGPGVSLYLSGTGDEATIAVA